MVGSQIHTIVEIISCKMSKIIDRLCNKAALNLTDSNYCFNSLEIGPWFKDLKHLIPGNGLPKLQG